MARVLVVEDEPMINQLLVEIIGELHVPVTGARDGASATAAFGLGVDLVLLDMRLPDADGLDLLVRFKRERPACRVCVMTGQGTPDVERAARTLGADGFLHKPFLVEDLLAVVSRMLPVAPAREPFAARPLTAAGEAEPP
ncbi:MAG: response regulator [Myxococcota bacterium]